MCEMPEFEKEGSHRDNARDMARQDPFKRVWCAAAAENIWIEWVVPHPARKENACKDVAE
jgi:hypothetical protein